ncbi:MAG TPA: immunoglobulin domain-containing protein, partial [Verrucomicrobiae bacterium]|nr:immunoglobulin domain-containing protein [Verrucomicrobiae bacterium]
VLTVDTPPIITTQPVSQTVTASATATLFVGATATPAPVYQWYLNGSTVGTNGSTLSIPNFQASDQGSYTVILSNALGAVTSLPALVLLDGPLRINSYSSSNGAFSLESAGVAGGTYTIEASSDLINWLPLFTNTAPNGYIDFTDTNAGAWNYRFYRAITNSP